MGVYLGAAILGGLGGARPTDLSWLDPLLLGSAGAGVAACGARSRTIPLYVATALAAALQPETVPLAIGGAAIVASIARRLGWQTRLTGAAAAGLAWACAVGAPQEPPADAVLVVVVAFAWLAWSARRHGGRAFRRRFDLVTATAGLLIVVAAALGALAVVNARSHVDRGTELLRNGLEAARHGDAEAATEDFRGAGRALRRGQGSLGAAWARPAWLVPGLSQNARALHEAVTEVRRLAVVGAIAAEDGDVDALRARSGKIDLAAVAATEAPLTDVIEQLRRSERAMDGLRDRFLVPPVEDRVRELRREIEDALPSAELALQGVRAAPELLGGNGPRTYLVLFTTPVEARAHLGFPGNYAELTFEDGQFEKTRFGRIDELNRGGTSPRSLSGPPDFLQRYARFEPATEWRSLTFSPDLPTVAQVAAELYPQSGGRPIDGVVTVDPTALTALLRFTGPIAVPGVNELITHENAADFLLRRQYVELPNTPERVDMLEELSDQTFDRLTEIDLPGPRDLQDVFGPIVEQGHLQMVAFDEPGGRFLDELGITGAFPPVQGDALAVTTSNAAMNKIDLFLRRSLSYDVRWDRSTGEVRATAIVTLTNEAPATGLPDYVIGNLVGGNRPGGKNLPSGWNNVFLTLYTPWRVEGAGLDGEPLGVEVLEELGRNAVTTVVELAPGQTRTLTFELRGFVDEDRYVLDLAAQPLVQPERLDLRVRAVGGPELRATGPVEVSGREAEGTLDLVRDERVSLE